MTPRQLIAFRVAVATILIDNGLRGKESVDGEVDKAVEIYQTVFESEEARADGDDPLEMIREGFTRFVKEFVRP